MAKKILTALEENLLKKLEENPIGDMSLEELGDATGLSRGTVSKYVARLELAGKVLVRPRGTMKLVRLNRTPQEGEGRGSQATRPTPAAR